MARLIRPAIAETGSEGAATYSAIYRLASRPYALSKATGGAGRFQFAAIYHAATATRNVRLRWVAVALESASAAAIVVTDLVRLDGTVAPAGGNPTITPIGLDANDPAAETTCLALPTTAGTVESSPIAMAEFNLGITGAASMISPPPVVPWTTLYVSTVDEQKPLLIRAGKAEGYAVTFDVNAAATINGFVVVEFTEELIAA
jgi:hypothetical protein